MYESPITLNIADISSQIRETQDGRLIYEVQQAIGYEIDKEELIKALNYDRDQYQKGYEDGRKDNEWIPVSKELPKPQTSEADDDYSDWVFVTLHIGEDNDIVCRAYYCFSDKKWYTTALMLGEVTAWKPLPEPYKGVSE